MKFVKKINEMFAGVNTVLSSFNNEEFNKIPFEGSWTAGRVTGAYDLIINGRIWSFAWANATKEKRPARKSKATKRSVPGLQY